MPAHRNPNNDSPKLGEMIHYVDAPREVPGIVSEIWTSTICAVLLYRHGAVAIDLPLDDYDPTPDPVYGSWHFDHRS